MKKQSIWGFVFFFSLLFRVGAAPVHFDAARKTAEDFYRVQCLSSSAKSVPEFTCVYPEQVKKGEPVPYYIFNAGENSGFVIVAGDDNATRLILGYSEKGRFEIENMPANLKSWLKFYEEGVRAAALSTVQTMHPKGFSKAEVIVEPVLGDISYNQDAPYNDLCPVDTRTGKISYSGCVATALASIARHYGYPAKGKGKIEYTTNTLGLELSMDFSKNTYDWANILRQYNGPLSQYSDIERTAVATLMRDIGYAVRMDYSSEASGTYREPAIIGMVDFMAYDSSASYRERAIYDNDEQWIAILKDNIDRDQPIYYAGSSPGGGHAFICDGYDDADYFHFNWGWGGSSDGYFVIHNLDPSATGIGAGSGGGYSFNQGIMHNLVPAGHAGSSDVFCLVTGDRVEPADRVEGEDYSVETDSISVDFTSFTNNTMSQFSGSIALGAYQDGELKQIISREEQVTIGRLASKTQRFTLTASLNGLEDGEYEIWTVGKPKGEGAQWQKIYGRRGGYDTDSYIPVSKQGDSYGLVKVSGKLTIKLECSVSRNISMGIVSDGVELGIVKISASSGGNVNLKYGVYDFWFHTYNFDTTYVKGLVLAGDTTIQVVMKETIIDPYIRACKVKGNTIELVWLKNPPRAEIEAFPTSFALYLDNTEVAVVGKDEVKYVFKDLSLGEHVVGLQSIFIEARSNIVTDTATITSGADNENGLQSACRISPNPSLTGKFTVETDRACTLHVGTVAGKMLFRKELETGSVELDMTGYPSGMYFFRFDSGRETTTLKAVLR